MNKILRLFLLTTVVISCVYHHRSLAQAPYSFTGPVAVFTYDNGGNRIKREIKTICVGIGCPPVSAEGSAGKPGHSVVTENVTTGVTSLPLIEAYPNPTESELYINNSTWQETDKALVVVYDINSKVVIKKEIIGAKGHITFSNITPGTYMVQYYLNNVPAQLWKIIKP